MKLYIYIFIEHKLHNYVLAGEVKFKYEPVWLTALSLLMIFLLYKCFAAYDPNRSIGFIRSPYFSRGIGFFLYSSTGL